MQFIIEFDSRLEEGLQVMSLVHDSSKRTKDDKLFHKTQKYFPWLIS
jgi:hypothetical protein